MKRRRFVWFVLGMLAVLIGLAGERQQVRAEEGNLLLNPGFEEAWDEAVWGKHLWEKDAAFTRMIRDDSEAHSGQWSGRIDNFDLNDARFTQKLAVEPESYYYFSCWVKTENIGADFKGANLSVEAIYETSQDIRGTSDGWQQIEWYGLTGPDQKEMVLTASLGGYSNTNTGTAWFDDLTVRRIDGLPQGVTATQLFAGEATEEEPVQKAEEPIFAVYLYLAVFFALLLVLLLRLDAMDRTVTGKGAKFAWLRPEGNGQLYVLLAASILLKLLFSTVSAGFETDINCFKSWALHAAGDLSGFYSGDFFADYPPLYIMVLSVIGRINMICNMAYSSAAYTMLIKLPVFLCEAATGYFLYRLAVKGWSREWALFIAGLYVLNPVVFVDSALWGQVDGVLLLALLLSFLAAYEGRWNRSAVWMMVAILLKPQGLLLLPILFFEMIHGQKLLEAGKRVVLATLSAAVVLVLVVLPFGMDKSPLWILELYRNTTAQYAYATMNGFNLYAALGMNLMPDSTRFLFLDANAWGMIFIFGLCIGIGGVYLKSKRRDIGFLMAAVMIAGVFVLAARMHERYMFPVLGLLAAAFVVLRDRRLLGIFLGFTVTNFINVVTVLARMILHGDVMVDGGSILVRLTALANVFLLIRLIRVAVDIALRDKIELEAGGGLRFFKDGRLSAEHFEPGITRRDMLIMAALTVGYLILSFVRLGDGSAPETEWLPTASGESFVYELEEKSSIGRLSYYCGLGEGWYATGTYRLEYEDEGGSWQTIGTLEKNDVFKWKTLDLNIEAQRLRFVVEAPGGSINEIALYDGQTKKALRGHVAERSDLIGPVENLFDEPAAAAYSPTYLNGTYFDEIYFARTAYEHLNGISPYENTHPPLGKLWIALGIKLLGMNTLGWRFVGNLFGAGMIPLMYVFGKRFFGNAFWAFCAAFLMMADFMHFTQTRIATIDGYVTFFIIGMFLFMHQYFVRNSYERSFVKSLVPLLFSGICFGLAAASKWIGLYGGAGLAFLFFLSRFLEYRSHKRQLKADGRYDKLKFRRYVDTRIVGTMAACVLLFVVIPFSIYMASYLPILLVTGEGSFWQRFIDMQKNMFDYHSTLVATHPFASPWWQWPILYKPVWYYSAQDMAQGMVSTIVALGNPAIWWTGIPAVGLAFVIAVANKDKRMVVPFAAICSQYLPWVLVTRITFMYHFFSTVPFMILCIVYVLRYLLLKWKKPKQYALIYLGVAALLFAAFYPVLSGMNVDGLYVEKLKWFDSWFF